MTLAEWLRAQIRARNISQNALAREAHVSPGTITAILRHGHVPSADIVRSLAVYLEADPDTVLEVAGIVELSDVPKDLSPELRDAVRRFYRLSKAEQEEMLNQINGLLRFFERARSKPEEARAGDEPQ